MPSEGQDVSCAEHLAATRPPLWSARHSSGCAAASLSARQKPQCMMLSHLLSAPHSPAAAVCLETRSGHTFQKYSCLIQHRNNSISFPVLQLPLYPTTIIPIPLGYSAGRGALIPHNLSVIPWLPACLGRSPCPAKAARLLASRAQGFMSDLTKNQTLFISAKPQSPVRSLGDLLPHSSPFFWFNVLHDCYVFSPKPHVKS